MMFGVIITMHNKPKSGRLVELDYLRFFSVVMIILSHFFNGMKRKGIISDNFAEFSLGFLPLQYDPLNLLFNNLGLVGVSFFVILSGAGLYLSYNRDKSIIFKEWFKKRVIKIYPKYLVVFFGVIISYFVFVGSLNSLNLSWGEFIASIFAVQAYFGFGGGVVNEATWFIGLILALYVFFWFFKDLYDRADKKVIFISLFIVSVISKYVVYFFFGTRAAKFVFITSLFEFSFVVLMLRYFIIEHKRLRAMLLLFLLSVATSLLFSTELFKPMGFIVFSTTYFLFMFYLFSLISSFSSKLNLIASKLSTLSYSLFLVHGPLLGLIKIMGEPIFLYVLYFPIVFVSAVILDFFVDKIILNRIIRY